MRVAIIDYGSGNLRSATKAFERAARESGIRAEIGLTADAERVRTADRIVLPGVGAYADCAAGLAAVEGMREAIEEVAIRLGRPFLGICVGMQILFERGVEHGIETAGCGEWPGVVERLDAPVLPHMGWNTVQAPEGSVLFAGLDPDTRFYFVHSYGVRKWELQAGPGFAEPLVTWAEHGVPFVAAVENGALMATQFHPEKSGDAGAVLLRNWLGTL